MDLAPQSRPPEPQLGLAPATGALSGRVLAFASRGAGALLRGLVYVVASPVVLLADLIQPDPRFERSWIVGFMVFITLSIVLTWGAGYVVTVETLEGNALLAGYSKVSSDLADLPYSNLIQAMAAEHGLDPALIAAIIRQESAFNPNAVSVAGARGLMQLLPSTWRLLNPGSPCDGSHMPPACGSNCIFDPEANIRAGTRYFAGVLTEFDENVVLAFAAYNAGSAAVEAYARGEGGALPDGDSTGLDDLPPYAETRTYVRKVLSFWVRLKTGGTPDVVTLSVEECRLLRQTSTVLPLAVLGLWALFASWVLRRWTRFQVAAASAHHQPQVPRISSRGGKPGRG